MPRNNEEPEPSPKPSFIRTKFPSLEQMHRDFELNCLNPEAPPAEHIALKRAFCAGALAMFQMYKLDLPGCDEDTAIKYMGSLEDDLIEFFTKTMKTPL